MAVNVIIKLDGMDDLKRNMPGFIRGLTRVVAKKTPQNVISSILKGKQGLNDLRDLPSNSIKTINRKRAQGKGALSLIDNKILTNISNWFIKKQGRSYKVGLKGSRKVGRKTIKNSEIAFHLRKRHGKRKAYPFMVKPKRHQPQWFRIILNRETAKFFSKYV